MHKPRIQFPSPRRALVRLHTDLIAVHKAIQPDLGTFPKQLTNFERLVLVLEDRRFFNHLGIDWKRLIREALRAVTFQRHGGASTIDMQLVRTATGYRENKFKRKAYELLLAHMIQYRYSKIEILRSYLSIAYFGTGMKGCERASKALFGTGSISLDLGQAAELAAMLVFPRPRAHSAAWEKKWLRRSNYIMLVYGKYKNRFDQIEKRIFV